MPTLWLNPMVELSPIDGPEVEARVRSAVIDLLGRCASWAPGAAGTVSWAPAGGLPAATPAEDCVVHVVGSYGSGVVQRLVAPVRDSIDPVRLAELSALDPPELGVTFSADGATASEVHLARCRRRLFGLRAHSTRLEGDRLENFALVVAAVAWHEAMHQKVDAAMGIGWDLHVAGGGAWAGTFLFGPGGEYLGARAPSDGNRQLMSQHFARPVTHFVPIGG